MRDIGRGLTVLLLLSGFLPEAGAGQGRSDLARFEYARLRMGTSVRLVLYARDEIEARQAADSAYQRMEDLEAILSHYRSDSELSRLSSAGGKGEQRIGPELLKVLETALKLSHSSEGAFDVTVGPLVKLWNEARRNKSLPETSALARARDLTGYEKLQVDSRNSTARLLKAGMSLDLSGVAKGFIADEALRILKARGVERALVDAGGDVVVSGAPPGRKGWRVAVETPEGERAPRKMVTLSHASVATSGDAYQFVEIKGVRYSHIVDPKTGMGVRGTASATVIAPDGLTADALATALSVMRPDKGIRLAESMKGVSAMVVRREGNGFRRFVSAGFPP